MPYNKDIEARVLKIVADWPQSDAKKMFGGICHLQNGNMFCGVYKDFLILRLGVDGADQALGMPFVGPFDITGKPMKGWVMVEQKGFDDDGDLAAWLIRARDFVETLPPK